MDYLHQAPPVNPKPPGTAEWVGQLPLQPVIDAGDARSEWVLLTVLGLGVLLLGLAYVQLLARRRRSRLGDDLIGMNQAIAEQQAEIEAQNQAIQAINSELVSTVLQVNQQRAALDRQQSRLAESIRYASRIQQSILPDAEQLACWPPHVLVYQPQPEVSGDFYWTDRWGADVLIGVVACRSSHMPGAFFSVLGASLLHQITAEVQGLDQLLLFLDQRLRSTLHTRQASSSLGIALLQLGPTEPAGQRPVRVATAGLPVFHQHHGRVERLITDQRPCGGDGPMITEPKVLSWTASPGERLFLLTDGALAAWPAQPLEDWLARWVACPLAETGHQVETALKQTPSEQTLDALFIGLEL